MPWKQIFKSKLEHKSHKHNGQNRITALEQLQRTRLGVGWGLKYIFTDQIAKNKQQAPNHLWKFKFRVNLLLMYFPLFMGVLCLSVFSYALLCVHSSFAIILKRMRKLVALLLLSYMCIVTLTLLWLFLTVPWVCL